MKTGRTFWLIMAFAALMALGAIRTRDIWFERMFVLAILVVFASLLWAWFSIQPITVTRTAREHRQQVGQYFKEKFQVQNHSAFSRLWVEICDLSNLKGQPGSKVLAQIAPHEDRIYLSRTLLTKRGLINLGPMRIISGDPFGIFKSSRLIASTNQLLVYPHFFRLENFPALPGYLSGGRQRKQKTTEVTPYAAGVREYQPGDPLSRIHWRTTARRDRTMVKEFEQDPQTQVWLYIDCNPDVQAGIDELDPDDRHGQLRLDRIYRGESVPRHTFEYLISAAASVADYYIRRNCNVGLATSGKIWFNLPVERGERQLQKIYEALTLVTYDGNHNAADLVEAQARQANRGATVVLFTASSGTDSIQAMDILIRRRLNPILILSDSKSFGGVSSGEEIIPLLQSRGVPYVLLRAGEDIKTKLEGK